MTQAKSTVPGDTNYGWNLEPGWDPRQLEAEARLSRLAQSKTSPLRPPVKRRELNSACFLVLPRKLDHIYQIYMRVPLSHRKASEL